jgi:hypothetical protein
MTAVVCFRKKDCIVFYSDGAAYSPTDATLVCGHQKTDIILHQPSLLVTQGSCWISARHLFYLISLRPSFDDAMASIAKDLHGIGVQAFRSGRELNYGVLLGGWSERTQSFELYRTWIGGKSPDDLEEGSLEIEKIASHKIDPDPDRGLLEERGIIKDGVLDLRAGDADVIKLMQCQRETPHHFSRSSFDEGCKGCIVGSFIQKTVLTRDAATTEIIHRWPDKVGEKLGIAGAALAASEPSPERAAGNA